MTKRHWFLAILYSGFWYCVPAFPTKLLPCGCNTSQSLFCFVRRSLPSPQGAALTLLKLGTRLQAHFQTEVSTRKQERKGQRKKVKDAWENNRHFATPLTVFPAKSVRNELRNSILTTFHYPDLCSASDWFKICFIQSEALPRSG